MKIHGVTAVLALVLAGGGVRAQGVAEAAEAGGEIVVTGVREHYRVRETRAAKIDAPLRDIPQTIDSVSGELLRDQRALSIQDALKNVPGVGFSSGDGQRDQVTLRGFSAIADQYVDGFRDDSLYFRDLSNIERVEVIKGPAAVLYGRGSSGGLINRVRKLPGTHGGQVAASVGSFDAWRLEGDVGAAGDGVAGRLTGAIERGDSYRDQQFIRRGAVAPSLRVGDERTALLVQADWLDDERVTDFGIPAFRGRPVAVPRGTYYGAANARDVDTSRAKVWSASAVLTHEFAGGWRLRNGFRTYDYRLARNNTLPGSVNEVAQTVSLNRSNLRREETGWFNQSELSGDVMLGGMTHRLLLGVEVAHQVKDIVSRTKNGIAVVDLFAPVNPVLPLVLNVAPANDNRARFATLGLYVQDLVTLTPRLKAMLGLRFDRFRQTTQQRLPGQANLARTDRNWSPRAGLVWQPDGQQSWYVSWSRSFQPSGENGAIAVSNADIAPEITQNYEVGGKFEFLGGRLGATVALFRLQRDNIKSTDPVTLKLIPIGTQRTNGVEASVTGSLGDGFQLVAGYAWLDARVVKSIAVDAGQPVQGKRATITPEHSGNLWLTKDFGARWGLGVGANAVGSRFANPGNTVVLPGYVTADALGWVQLGRVRVQANVRNIFDRGYIVAGHGTNANLNLPGGPRTVLVTARVGW
ncbi:TonB-dependent receptor [Sandaracinobacteroides saxicola]|uniref:TonB-dependent siderophore receptor n=1 Tax=Sandaracinobacteroides saxicola TaxID=2759707 RepID=A0A7G5IKF2_9SPHN|nr:TonB-dependent siderophore receptor [Sandaracinobacteroides saxicola]QMW23844.1 TonB-dependent siderophore receptor [Sandaracinobacteroides saxicola]